MSHECDYCPEVFSTEKKLDTHYLLHHREEAVEDGLEFDSPVSEGFLTEQPVEKGEQFGYQK